MHLCVEEMCLFVCLPTGFGKSICYMVLPLLFIRNAISGESIVLVVSLLKALMADQVECCCAKGLKSACVCGDEESRKVYNSVICDDYQVVFISPEMLIGKKIWRDTVC